MNSLLLKVCLYVRNSVGQITYCSRYFSSQPSISKSDHLITSNITKQQFDLIGLPDKISNIRPLILHKKQGATPLEEELWKNRTDVHNWNQDFWSKHNQRFYKEREEFVKQKLKDSSTSTLTADEMSVFYKAFLDKNWKVHLNYNIHWYKKNIALLALSFRVTLQNIFNKTWF